MIKNSRGKIFYGMHMYPGVARYEKPNENPLTVFINESTIRKMGPSFAGRPIFVEHIDDVNPDVNELRGEADGWVMESFFNEADGKNWVKFVLVSDLAFEAVRRGFRLSNAYIPQLSLKGGVWNGIDYQQEVIDGEYEHLAIVQNPRYEESVIMDPEQFKAYNEQQKTELIRFANSKNKRIGETKMKLNIFKRQKMENSIDLDGLVIELPISKKEVVLTDMVKAYDKIMNMNGYASGDHMVKLNEKEEMSVSDLVKKHQDMCNEMDEMKKAKNADSEDGGEPGQDDDPAMENTSESEIVAAGDSDVGDRGGDMSLNNEEDEEEESEADKKAKAKKAELKNALKVKEDAKIKAARLKNANIRNGAESEMSFVSLPADQVARGKSLYGSGN